MSEDIEFSIHERRILGLPFDQAQRGPEALALRKIINAMPWILCVAEHGFDSTVADAALVFEAAKCKFHQAMEECIKSK